MTRRPRGLVMHPDQLEVPVEVVRRLVRDQFPAWASLPVLEAPGHGTVNALYRIGKTLVARFPLQPGDVDATRAQLVHEANAARRLLGATRFPTPEPVALGEPGPGYPLPWSVQTWLPGTVATPDDPASSVAFAHDLAELVAGVRAIDRAGAVFAGPGRGGDLVDHDAWVQTCLERSRGLLDVPRLRGVWADLRELPRPTGGDLMTHGDLIPGNVLVDGGRLAGVLDVGGLGPADPALDLVAGWHLLERGPRQRLRADLGCGEVEWARGRAWAFEQAIGACWYYVESNPTMSLMGRRTLERLLCDG